MTLNHLFRFFYFSILVSSTYLAGRSIEVSMAMAGDYNPEVKSAYYDVEIEKVKIRDAYSEFQPTVVGTYRSGRYNNSQISESILSVDQPLFDGFGSINRYQQAKKDVKSRKYHFKGTLQKTFLDAALNHLEVVRQEELYLLNQENVSIHEEFLEITRKRQELKDVTLTDYYQTLTRLQSAQDELRLTQGNLAISKANYFRIVGVDAIDLEMPVCIPDLPVSLEEVTKFAEEKNYQILRDQKIYESAKAGERISRSRLMPSVSLQGNFEENKDFPNENSLMVNVTVPIYEGGFNYNDLRRSRRLTRRAYQGLSFQKKSLKNEAVAAWEQMEAAKELVNLRKDIVENAQKTVDGYKVEVDYGTRSNVDLLDARRELFRAKVEHVNSQNQYLGSVFRLTFILNGL